MIRKLDTVLVVDDEPDLCWVLSHLVQSRGWSVKILNTGEEAREALLKFDFGLVFLDAKLPDLNGLEVLSSLRKAGKRYPPVIMVSGYHYSDDPVICEAIQQGVINAFIAKPFEMQDIFGILDRFGYGSRS